MEHTLLSLPPLEEITPEYVYRYYSEVAPEVIKDFTPEMLLELTEFCRRLTAEVQKHQEDIRAGKDVTIDVWM